MISMLYTKTLWTMAIATIAIMRARKMRTGIYCYGNGSSIPTWESLVIISCFSLKRRRNIQQCFFFSFRPHTKQGRRAQRFTCCQKYISSPEYAMDAECRTSCDIDRPAANVYYVTSFSLILFIRERREKVTTFPFHEWGRSINVYRWIIDGATISARALR